MVFAVTSCNGIIICYTGIDGYSLQQEIAAMHGWLLWICFLWLQALQFYLPRVLSVVSLCWVIDSDAIPSTRRLLLLLCSVSAFHVFLCNG